MNQTLEQYQTNPKGVTSFFEQWATRAMFLLAGFAMATWAALIPFAKSNVGANEAELGALLLSLGIGALISMPICGPLTTKFGCKKVIVLATLLFSIMLPVLLSTNNIYILAGSLFFFGMGIGGTECAMNIQAVIVERKNNKPLMSGFHGFYSVGGIIGAGLSTLLLTLSLSAIQVCLAGTLFIIFILFYYRKGLLTYANPSEGPLFSLPRGPVLIIGMICFIMFMSEGTVLDWSAVYLIEEKKIAENLGGLGFGAFAVAMTIGRLTGDKIVSNVGPFMVAVIGALIAVTGLMITIFFGSWEASLLGYALMGAGCSNISPVMFSAIGRQTKMPQAVAVPAVTTMAYSGVLAGPAIIGFIAHHISLSAAFSFVVIMLFVALGLTKQVKFA